MATLELAVGPQCSSSCRIGPESTALDDDGPAHGPYDHGSELGAPWLAEKRWLASATTVRVLVTAAQVFPPTASSGGVAWLVAPDMACPIMTSGDWRGMGDRMGECCEAQPFDSVHLKHGSPTSYPPAGQAVMVSLLQDVSPARLRRLFGNPENETRGCSIACDSCL